MNLLIAIVATVVLLAFLGPLGALIALCIWLALGANQVQKTKK